MSEHECCECVERLRRQNKESSDAWTRRIADTQSELDGLNHLMREAWDISRGARKTAKNYFVSGMSRYAQAALAVALKEADEAVQEVATARAETHRWRRKAEQLEARLHRYIQLAYEKRNDA